MSKRSSMEKLEQTRTVVDCRRSERIKVYVLQKGGEEGKI